MIYDALKGYNVTILAYGQTSSGKTHTISGTDEYPGLIVLTAKSLFKSLKYLVTPEGINAMPAPHNNEVNFTERRTQVTISFLEIYNESVNDLLNCTKRNLEVRENRNGDVIVDGLTNKVVTCEEEFLTCMHEGDAIRMSAETRANIHSSRSHTVFRIQVEIIDINTETGRRSIRTSQINLVDLAGSEGASKTQSEGLRLREGGNINKSLLALSNVIHKLSLRQQISSRHNYFINFRDSKLTRILQNALSGHSQISIICCIN
jgi:centromeric protein E